MFSRSTLQLQCVFKIYGINSKFLFNSNIIYIYIYIIHLNYLLKNAISFIPFKNVNEAGFQLTQPAPQG